jgi:formate dehydrogenase subunit gamma
MTQITSRPPNTQLPRFDRVERYAHWCTATLMLILLFTGFAMYEGPLSTILGRRLLMRNIHLYSGLLLPIPVLVAIALRAGAQLRTDLGRLNRWTRDDRAWWSKRRRANAQLGKFNPGQKLNATFIGASIFVMLMSGSILQWYKPFSDSWRQGATFVHDWFAIGLLFAILGHITLAFRDPDALNGMTHGTVSAGWAKRHRPRWYAEVAGSVDSANSVDGGGAVGARGALDPVGDVVTSLAENRSERGHGAGEVPLVDPVDGGAGDGFGEREL